MAKSVKSVDPQSSLLIDARAFALRLSDTGVTPSIQFDLAVQVFDLSLEIATIPAGPTLDSKTKTSLALRFAKLCSSFHAWAFTEIESLNLLTKLNHVGKYFVSHLTCSDVLSAFDALPTSHTPTSALAHKNDRTRIQNVFSHFSNLT